MKPDESPKRIARVPDHYATVPKLLKTLGRSYLRSLDSTVRVLGFCIISGILFTALGAALKGISMMLHYEEAEPFWITIVCLLLAPPIIRAGVLGAGLRAQRKAGTLSAID